MQILQKIIILNIKLKPLLVSLGTKFRVKIMCQEPLLDKAIFQKFYSEYRQNHVCNSEVTKFLFLLKGI